MVKLAVLTVFVLLAVAAMASPAPSEPKMKKAEAADIDVTPFRSESIFLAANKPGAWCGGFTDPECSNECYIRGFRCYSCQEEWCLCTNDGC